MRVSHLPLFGRQHSTLRSNRVLCVDSCLLRDKSVVVAAACESGHVRLYCSISDSMSLHWAGAVQSAADPTSPVLRCSLVPQHSSMERQLFLIILSCGGVAEVCVIHFIRMGSSGPPVVRLKQRKRILGAHNYCHLCTIIIPNSDGCCVALTDDVGTLHCWQVGRGGRTAKWYDLCISSTQRR